MKQPVILIALLAAGAATAADGPSFDAQRLSQHVKTLSSDAFEGRGPNTAGEEKTVAYLIEQFKAAGLQPGGDSKNGKRLWTQAVPLGRFEIKGPVVASVSLGGKAKPLQQGNEIAIRAAMNGQTSVAIKDAPLVFVGYGVKAPERNWDDFKGVDLKGKIAVVLINDPDFETGQGAFGGKAMTYYGRWTYKFEEMARQGAIGTMIVHETAPASYGWPTVKNSNTNVMFDIVRQEPQKSHAQLESWIQRDTAVAWFKQAGLNFDTLKKQAQTPGFKPVTLKGVTFTADYAVDAQTIVSQNVVARLEGSKNPKHTVIYSGHWDHLGVGAPDAKGDTIYNGAVDNGTGIAGMIELARAYGKAPKTHRSVVFLAVTAEEKGLLGSEYYAANPVFPLGKTVAMINMDALSPGGKARNFSISGNAKLELLDRLVATAAKWNVAYSPDPKPEAGHFFRSDHFPMAKRGVPAISFGSGDDLLVGGKTAGDQEEADYTKLRYHQPADEWQAGWSFEGMSRDLEILYALGRDLANSNDWPNWAVDSEFRGARDRSASERKGD
ncbi:MAG: M28 family metallopeptidase [Arenimonas sp.]|uniref:M28 family metallopeptidase n=1 Tax=Arenimonas sp. TaxID=1872635 RepID=UPI003C01360E